MKFREILNEREAFEEYSYYKAIYNTLSESDITESELDENEIELYNSLLEATKEMSDKMEEKVNSVSQEENSSNNEKIENEIEKLAKGKKKRIFYALNRPQTKRQIFSILKTGGNITKNIVIFRLISKLFNKIVPR